jgi:Uma2 family endonuclease
MWNQKIKGGVTFDSSAGFRLPNNAMRSPDAAWISSERWNRLGLEDKKRFAAISPDFIIELRSESDSLVELKVKMTEWVQNGTKLAWLIDPIEEKAYIYKLDGSIEEVDSFDKILEANEIVKGFSINLTLLKNKN